MVFVLDDRVRETSTTTGTGDVTLSGAVSGFQRFQDAMATNDICFYAIIMGASWETGLGTLTAATTLARTTVYSSSNSDSLVNFGAGTKDVIICLPGTKAKSLYKLFTHGADIAAATTINLETATGDLVDITGNTQIDAVTLSEGHQSWARFTGTPQLTNGASLVVQDGTRTMAAGDYVHFKGYAAGVVRATVFSASTIATQADQEAATSTVLRVTSGRQHYHPGHPKCWAYVTVSGGVPTLQASYNVTSITDTGVGQCTITIATDFSSQFWTSSCGGDTAGSGDTKYLMANKGVGTIELRCYVGTTLTDPSDYNFTGCGDQA